MSTAVLDRPPPPPPQDSPSGRGSGGPAPREIVVAYGFWIFLLSDIIMFSAFFAAYAVLSGSTAGGPVGKDLFDIRNAAIETIVLLFSSYACGLAVLGGETSRFRLFYFGAAATFILGAAFLTLEVTELSGFIARGAGPDRSAFLSAFFSLVGLHGLHVTFGLGWLVFMIAQMYARGPREYVLRRLYCFGLFWHALDIIWVALFTLVYLLGAR